MVCELVDIATLNLGVRAECFQGEGALRGNLRRHLIVRRCAVAFNVLSLNPYICSNNNQCYWNETREEKFNL